MGWLAAFFLFFFSFTLPNNPHVGRFDLVQELPFLLLDLVDPPQDQPGPPSGWRYFPQRLDVLAPAALILAGAWGLGGLLLRGLRVPLERGVERTVFSFALGLSGLSLITLLSGLAGWLSRPWLGSVAIAAFLGEVGLRVWQRRQNRVSVRQPIASEAEGEAASIIGPLCALAVAPFLLAMLLGAMLPSTDFDVKEYHLQGPKEFFQNGRVGFLPHNVYTSFPFLTEMLSLLGMVLRNDWYWGALSGKAVLMTFAPLTALALYAAGRRWFNPAVGWLAAAIHLTTPWTYRISVIAYAEGGLTFYLFATLLAVMLGIDRLKSRKPAGRLFLLAGLLAGSAMACKYPALISVVFPMAAVTAAACFFLQSRENTSREQPETRKESEAARTPEASAQSAAASAAVASENASSGDGSSAAVSAVSSKLAGRPHAWCGALAPVALFILGTAVTVGPWLIKNLAETGNPVYPLAYSVFGGREWDAQLDAKWKRGHGPDHHRIGDLGVKFIDVTAKSDWLSPLLFGLAPLALFANRRRRTVGWLFLYVGYLFLTWWVLTHRIDRFWIPLIPVVALLAAVGAAWRTDRVWRYGCGALMVFAGLFNLAYVTTPLCGYNAYLVDLNYARRQTAQITSPEILLLNDLHERQPIRVLSVGDAEVFDARFPVVYNTVFDDDIFQQWTSAEEPGVPDGRQPLRDPAEIRRRFREEGITHVYVNWQEILRYRLTYRYTDPTAKETGPNGTGTNGTAAQRPGYTDYVAPQRFEFLQQQGILGPPLADIPGYRPFENLNPQEQQEIETWAPSLIIQRDGKRWLTTSQVFPVLD